MDDARKSRKSRSARRETPPTIRHVGVRARWSARHGWTFRAVIGFEGRRVVGPARATQDEAAEDYRRLRAGAPAVPMSMPTLDEALERVVRDARERGAGAGTMRWGYEYTADYLREWFRGDARVAEIDADAIKRFVRLAREDGRHPNTLLAKDLPMLARVFRVSALDDPIPAVRAELRQTLKRIPPSMSFFTPDELREILRRMRDAVWRVVDLSCDGCDHVTSAIVEDRPGPQNRRCDACRRTVPVRELAAGRELSIPGRQTDADLVMLLALTGIRTGELGRITLADVDLKRRQIAVVSKDRGHPRRIEIIDDLVPIVDRLCAAARERSDRTTTALVPGSMNLVCRLARRWKARLEEPRLNGRTLRHTFVTGLLYSGAVAAEAKGLAGHRNLSTTDRYTHEISRRRVDVLQAWSRRLRDGDDAPPNGTPTSEAPPPEL